MAGEQFIHHGGEIRRKVLDDDEGCPGFGAHDIKQQFEGLETASRSADRNDTDRPAGLIRIFGSAHGACVRRQGKARGTVGRLPPSRLAARAVTFGLARHLFHREFTT
jgi:hypothetical protein